LLRAQLAELGDEFFAVLHRGVIGLVGAEETPDGLKFAEWLPGIDRDGNGERRDLGGTGGGNTRRAGYQNRLRNGREQMPREEWGMSE
jgi:hypothetical protein